LNFRPKRNGIQIAKTGPGHIYDLALVSPGPRVDCFSSRTPKIFRVRAMAAGFENK